MHIHHFICFWSLFASCRYLSFAHFFVNMLLFGVFVVCFSLRFLLRNVSLYCSISFFAFWVTRWYFYRFLLLWLFQVFSCFACLKYFIDEYVLAVLYGGAAKYVYSFCNDFLVIRFTVVISCFSCVPHLRCWCSCNVGFFAPFPL